MGVKKQKNRTPKKTRCEMVFAYQNYLFFAGILLAEHALSKEIILNEVMMGGRATIKVTLASSVDF